MVFRDHDNPVRFSALMLGLLLSWLTAAAWANPSDNTENSISGPISEPTSQQASQSNPEPSLEQRRLAPPNRQLGRLARNRADQGDAPLADKDRLWTTAGALVGVLVLIMGLAWLAKRMNLVKNGTVGGKTIEVLSRTFINPKQSLCLVRLGEQLILVGQSPNHLASLGTIDDPDQVAFLMGKAAAEQPNSIQKSFDGLIRRETHLYDKDGQSEMVLPVSQTGTDGAVESARTEVQSLLDKVKGLARIHYR